MEQEQSALAATEIALHSSETDHPQFLEAVTNIANAMVAAADDVHGVYEVHIDNWFGRKWLGFWGKVHGAVGVRSYNLQGRLNAPPFNPNRVLSQRYYHKAGSGFQHPERVKLHVRRPSETNLACPVRNQFLYLWYSANSIANGKGSLMCYLASPPSSIAWYAVLDENKDWQPSECIGISREELAHLIGQSI